MRVRHRIPSIFNLSMVDVLCCALGCVILLWLLNLRQAKEEEEKASVLRASAAHDHEEATLEIERRKAAIAVLEAEAASLRETLTARGVRIAALEKQLRDDEARIAALGQAIATGETQLRDTRAAADKRAADLEAARAALDKKITELLAKLSDADKRALAAEAARVALNKKANDLGGRLSDSDKRMLELAALLAAAEKRGNELKLDADLVPALKAQLTATQQKMDEAQKDSAARLRIATRALDDMKAARSAAELTLKSTEEKLTQLQKDVATNKTSLAATDRELLDLRNQKRTLENEVVRFRLAADNRFAGITLTGRRVVFLVDMSGSMDYVDENTKSPTKWAEVRETLLKVMKSLPDLEKFQIIVFSEKASFLMGRPDLWFDYDPKTSLGQVEAALKAVKPDGGTNMYAALEAAFRYRPRGLDTIYLLSDGLPNTGEGVPDDEARRLLQMRREPELSDRLAKYIRKTLKTNWNRDILKERVRINAIGFFYESPDVGAFLWALARENDGSFVGMSKP